MKLEFIVGQEIIFETEFWILQIYAQLETTERNFPLTNCKFDRWTEICSLLWFWHTVLPLNFNGYDMNLSVWKGKPPFLMFKCCKVMWKTGTHWKVQKNPVFCSSPQYPENRDILRDTGEWRCAHRCFPNAVWRVKNQEILGLLWEGRLSKLTLDHNSKQWYLNATFPSLKLLETLFWLLRQGERSAAPRKKCSFTSRAGKHYMVLKPFKALHETKCFPNNSSS